MSSCPNFASGPLSHGAAHPTSPVHMQLHYSSSSLAAALDEPHRPTRRSSSHFHPLPLSSASAYQLYPLAPYVGSPPALTSPASTCSPSSEGTQDLPFELLQEAHNFPQISLSAQHHPMHPQGGLDYSLNSHHSSPSIDDPSAWAATAFKTHGSVPGPEGYASGVHTAGDFIGGGGGHAHPTSPTSHNFPSPIMMTSNSPIHVKLESPTLSSAPVVLHHDYQAFESYADSIAGATYTSIHGGQGMQLIRSPVLYYDSAHGPYEDHSVKYEGQFPLPPSQHQEVAVCDPRALAGEHLIGASASSSTISTGAQEDLGDEDADGEWEDIEAPVQMALSAEIGGEGESDQEAYSTDEGSLYDGEESEYDDSQDGDYGSRKRKRSTPRKTPARKRSTASPASYGEASDGSVGYVDESFFAPMAAGSRHPRPSKAAPSVLPLPVPVPNLTKKSRGRRVPTVSAIVVKGGVMKNSRAYACRVPGCGKCFARGEHLKRHVRSIHTNEKPHVCTHPGCEKAFSRHDNLRQHMRVHKDYSFKHED